MHNADYWIKKLELGKHPEGGWFKEIYRAEDVIPKVSLNGDFSGDRNYSTSIYYLLEKDDFSSFHRIRSDEIWHFYTGTSAIEILWIDENQLIHRKLGADFDKGEQFQVAVPKNKWFAALLCNPAGFALVGCTVSPGFHFEDFKLADMSLLNEYPHLNDEIKLLIRK